MRLIADSGSTKTTWLIESNQGREIITTPGLNPAIMGLDTFRQEIQKVLQPNNIKEIQFYGAGCTPTLIPTVRALFEELFPNADEITIGSDLLLAARQLCGYHEGIAAILGTGSNSCLYDGRQIVQQTPALGYILGDEGSGAVLGKHLINALFKGRLSRAVEQDFRETYPDHTLPDVIQHVYQQPGANKWLASLCPFIGKHTSDQTIRKIIIDSFRAFIANNITPYGRPDLHVDCVGSIAYHFADLLREAANAEGHTIGKILKHPIE